MIPNSRTRRITLAMENSTRTAPRWSRRRHCLLRIFTAMPTLAPSALLCGLGHPRGSLDSSGELFPGPVGTSPGFELVRSSNPLWGKGVRLPSFGMLRVGLSGGIGSGKSTVARALARHGAVVIDAD